MNYVEININFTNFKVGLSLCVLSNLGGICGYVSKVLGKISSYINYAYIL